MDEISEETHELYLEFMDKTDIILDVYIDEIEDMQSAIRKSNSIEDSLQDVINIFNRNKDEKDELHEEAHLISQYFKASINYSDKINKKILFKWSSVIAWIFFWVAHWILGPALFGMWLFLIILGLGDGILHTFKSLDMKNSTGIDLIELKNSNKDEKILYPKFCSMCGGENDNTN
ncbi:MAG: MFS transporter, partial [archaeon]|nr:MFS transporter [archaeon]